MPTASRFWTIYSFRDPGVFSRPNAQRGTAVVLGAAEYERLLEEIEVLRDVRQAEQQMEAGLGTRSSTSSPGIAR